MLKVAGIEPVFVGYSYREMEAGMAKQLSDLAPSRRKAVRRQALRLISEAQGLEHAADQLVPRPLQQGIMRREPPIQPSLKQMPRRQAETPLCSVCRMRFGLRKRSFPSQAAAQQLCERQKDPGLVVYACPAGAGFHLGHPENTRPATACHPPTTPQQRVPHRIDAHAAPMLPTPLHKESPMKMNVTLGNPFLIAIYSASLLLIGCAVGMHWAHTPATALWISLAGGLLMAVHDSATAILWFWLTARWAYSVIERKDR
jgi:hypothetical protein